MADTRLSALGALSGASVASVDLLEVVDVSDTSMAPTGTNKSITAAELAIALKALSFDAAYQPKTAALTTLSGLTATTDNFIVSVGSAWASRTPAQVKTTLAIAESDVASLTSDLALKAPLANPTFTGTVTLPAQTVTRAMEVNQAANSLRGNNTGSAATALDLTVAQVKTLLAYTAGDISAQPADADLTTWAGITPGTGVGTFLATPSSANLAAAVTGETGTGALVFGTSPTFAGTVAMTPGTLVGGGTSMTGGLVDPINHLHLSNTYTQTATPTSATVGTPLRIESNVTLNYAHPLTASSLFGPRGLANIEGTHQYNFSTDDLFGLTALGLVDMLNITNQPGTPINLTPAWTFVSARKYIADGAVVTAQQPDAAEGPFAFYDSNVFISKNTGQWDGLTNNVVIGSYISNPFVLGNAHFRSRRAFQVRDVNDYLTDLAGPLGADGSADGDVQHNVGLYVDYMTTGTVSNVGVWNWSGTVEPAQVVSMAAASVLTVNATNVDLDTTGSGDITLTANPWITAGVDGQRVRLNMLGTVDKLIIPQNHGAIFLDPDDAGNVRLMPSTGIDLVYKALYGAWVEPTYRHARHLYTGKLSYGGSIRTHSEAVGPNIEFRTVDTDTYATAALGVLGGVGTYAAGSGAGVPDTLLQRASAGVWSTVNSSLTLGTGSLTAKSVSITGLTGAANPTRYVGATTTGAAPTTGTFAVGDYVISTFGALAAIFVCTTAGSPGSWIGLNYQPLDADLTAIAALTSAANKVPYSTGAGTWALAAYTAEARTLDALTDPNADRLVFWDDSASSYAYLTPGTNLTISGTTIDAASPANDSITNAVLANMATSTIKGRVTAGTGDPEDLSVAQVKTLLNYVAADFPTLAPLASPTFTGTVVLPAQTVTRAMIVNAAANSFIGNNTGSAATEIAMTVAQAKTLLAYVAADIPTLAPLASPTFTGTVVLPLVSLTDTLTITDAKNIVLNATTGTKIGTATTQKLGFLNATPIAQEANSVDLGQVLSDFGFRASGGNPPLNLGTALITAGSATLIGSGTDAGADFFVLGNVATLRLKNVVSDAQFAAILTANGSFGALKLGPGGATAPGFTLTATSGTAATLVGTLTLPGPVLSAGTTSVASIVYTSGTLLTNAAVGAQEFDGTQFYATVDTTSGRGMMPAEQYFRLAADGGTISTIANFFGATSNISLVANAYYEIEVFCWFLNTTAGTVVWTFTNSAAPTNQNIHYRYSPIAGVNTGAGGADYIEGDIVKDATAAKATTVSGTLATAVNHYAHFKIWLRNGTGTSLKIQATKAVGGTITPLYGSYWKARRLPASSIGTFAA